MEEVERVVGEWFVMVEGDLREYSGLPRDLTPESGGRYRSFRRVPGGSGSFLEVSGSSRIPTRATSVTKDVASKPCVTPDDGQVSGGPHVSALPEPVGVVPFSVMSSGSTGREGGLREQRRFLVLSSS